MAFVSSCSASGDGDDAESAKKMRTMFGPQAVDQAIGQAITTCWMILPDERKTVSNVAAEIRRIVDRALKNLEEDSRAFGIDPPS